MSQSPPVAQSSRATKTNLFLTLYKFYLYLIFFPLGICVVALKLRDSLALWPHCDFIYVASEFYLFSPVPTRIDCDVSGAVGGIISPSTLYPPSLAHPPTAPDLHLKMPPIERYVSSPFLVFDSLRSLPNLVWKNVSLKICTVSFFFLCWLLIPFMQTLAQVYFALIWFFF